jgi:hypothetical protein
MLRLATGAAHRRPCGQPEKTTGSQNEPEMFNQCEIINTSICSVPLIAPPAHEMDSGC